ncbi:hypothetical protein MJN51_33645, partial [Salmonella enterica subsp. enterica serovar Kentucky]|nr:hypothetical protein [Salmonella enterica subsp. enterica serovar Kentucky]
MPASVKPCFCAMRLAMAESVKGAGDASVYAHGGAVTINNSGTMDSSVFGVYVTTGHTLNNLA